MTERPNLVAPVGRAVPPGSVQPRPGVDDLDGCSVGFLDNTKQHAGRLLRSVGEGLARKGRSRRCTASRTRL